MRRPKSVKSILILGYWSRGTIGISDFTLCSSCKKQIGDSYIEDPSKDPGHKCDYCGLVREYEKGIEN